MKTFFLVLVVLFVSCKTCPANEEITEAIVTGLAGYGECGGYEAMKGDIAPLVERLNFCGKAFDTQKHLRFVSSGVCTPYCIVCSSVLKQIDKYPADWLCKKPPLSPTIIDLLCQKL
jgi:hypothetical protein